MCVCVRMHTRIRSLVYICVSQHTCVCVSDVLLMCVSVCRCEYECVCVRARARVCVYIYKWVGEDDCSICVYMCNRYV